MKKLLVFFLCIIMILAAAMPAFAAGTDPGTVVKTTTNGFKKRTDGGDAYVTVYNYANDAEAVQWGAIAKFTMKDSNTVYYIKDMQTIFGWGGGSTYNTTGITQMLVSEWDSNFNDEHLLCPWGRKITIRGAEGGTVINTPVRFRFDCSEGGQVTLENITINATKANTSMAVQLNPDSKYTKLVLKNSTIKAADDANLANGVIVMNANSTLILEEGGKVLSSKAATSNDVINNCGVRLNQPNTKLTVKDGAEIKTAGSAIYAPKYTEKVNNVSTEKPLNATVDIQGGTIESGLTTDSYTNRRTVNIYGGNVDITISGGTFKTAEDYMFHLVNGNSLDLTISGGNFTSENGGIIACGAAGIKVNVTSGEFKAAKGSMFFTNNSSSNCVFTMSGGNSNTKNIANIGGNATGGNTVNISKDAICKTSGTGIDVSAAKTNVTISGGTIESAGDGIVVSAANANVTISGGTIESTGATPVLFGGGAKDSQLNITGGSLLATLTEYDEDKDFEAGSAIFSYGKIKAKIDGGYLYSKVGKGAIRVNSSYGSTEGSEFIINGGTFECGGRDSVVHFISATATINGGDFIANGAYGIVISETTKTSIDKKDPETGEVLTDDAGNAIKETVFSTVNGNVTVNGGNYYGPAGAAFRHHSQGAVLTVNNATVYGVSTPFASTHGNGTVVGGDLAITSAAMEEGAAVRTKADSSGIRFQSKISAETIDAIAKIDENYVVGTLITTYDALVDAEGKTVCEFSIAALDEAGVAYRNIVAKDGIHDKETYYLVNAALTGLSEANYDRDFVAVTYISYKTANGTITIYSAWNEEDNVRNIKEVAYSALADVKKDGDVIAKNGDEEITINAQNAYEYGYNVVNEWYDYDEKTGVATLVTGTAYTQYSADQRAVIAEYIKTVNA